MTKSANVGIKVDDIILSWSYNPPVKIK